MSPFFDWRLIPVLVVTLAVNWLVLRSEAARLRLVTVVSLAVLAAWQPGFAVLAVLLVSAVHFSFNGKQSTPRKLLGWVALSLSVLVALKGATRIATALSLEGSWAERYLVLPLGVSYFVFRLIQYAADHHRGVLRNDSLWRALAFFFFLPSLPAGPLQSFQDFHGGRGSRFDPDLFHSGLRRALWGYFKKLVVLELAWDASLEAFSRAFLDAGPAAFTSAPRMAAKVVGLGFLRAYLDLSAYTDIALGLGGMLGFRLPENFDRPLASPTLTSFWRRWHMSLGSWCRDQVFFPVLGLTRRPWVAAYAAMIAMALWHDLSWNWLAWGIYHGTGLCLWGLAERKLGRLRLAWLRWARPLGVGVTLAFVALGFALTSTRSLSDGIALYVACVEGVSRALLAAPAWLVNLVAG